VLSVLDDWTLPPTELSAVYPGGRRATAKVRAFVAYVEASMKRSGSGPAAPRLSVVHAQ